MANRPQQTGNEPNRVEAADDVRRLNIFLNDIGLSPYLSVPIDTERAAKSVLCNVFTHVSSGEVDEFMSKLPSSFHRVLQCARSGPEAERFGRSELLSRVSGDLGIPPVQAENVCRAVLQAIRWHVPAQQIDNLQSQLPQELVEFFGPPTRRVA